MIFDSDDFGCNRIISDMCQSHDCRDVLIPLKEAQPGFKVTLFTIPGETTYEIMDWARSNSDWVELAWHGFYHTSNYECEKMTFDEFDILMEKFYIPFGDTFIKGFKAPGWQISDDIYYWLKEAGFWVADQNYNSHRRPEGLRVYEIGDNSLHTHTWDCVGNGVYEMFDRLLETVKQVPNWKFISEVV